MWDTSRWRDRERMSEISARITPRLDLNVYGGLPIRDFASGDNFRHFWPINYANLFTATCRAAECLDALVNAPHLQSRYLNLA